MLALTRRKGEKVILFTSDGPITIILTKTSRACLVIDAPKSVRILRDGLILDENSKGKAG